MEQNTKILSGIILKALAWYQAYQVSKLDEKPGSPWSKAAAVLLPGWYSSFKIANIAPEKTPENSGWHTLGKIIFPYRYSAFQMAKLKSPDVGIGKKALAIIFAPVYGPYAATVLAKRKSQGGQSLAQSQPRFNMMMPMQPQSAFNAMPQIQQPLGGMMPRVQQPPFSNSMPPMQPHYNFYPNYQQPVRQPYYSPTFSRL